VLLLKCHNVLTRVKVPTIILTMTTMADCLARPGAELRDHVTNPQANEDRHHGYPRCHLRRSRLQRSTRQWTNSSDCRLSWPGLAPIPRQLSRSHLSARRDADRTHAFGCIDVAVQQAIMRVRDDLVYHSLIRRQRRTG
jgi:hypothetical protein